MGYRTFASENTIEILCQIHPVIGEDVDYPADQLKRKIDGLIRRGYRGFRMDMQDVRDRCRWLTCLGFRSLLVRDLVRPEEWGMRGEWLDLAYMLDWARELFGGV